MSVGAGQSIAIIGGGASGVILAANLVRAGARGSITLIERTPDIGRGLAYGTDLPDHRLNVAANRMSGFPDDPLDFWRWHTSGQPHADGDATVFLPRRDYARYLDYVFQRAQAEADGIGRLRRIEAECRSISHAGSGLELRLSNGTSLMAQAAVLATGHDPQPVADRAYAVPPSDLPQIDRAARVTILGSGLSMIDTWLSLEARGHRGEIVAVSRRGLLPQPHRPRHPIKLDPADIPLGTELSYFVRWLSDLIEATDAAGGDWRDVIDGIRPYNQRIWRDWPTSAKRRFLEHAKAWWDVHRHRIAPDVYARAQKAIDENRLVLLAGRVTSVHQDAEGMTTVSIRKRGQTDLVHLDCAAVIDCTGIVKDPAASANPLISSMIASGLARPDPLRIGLDISANCQVIDAKGNASNRILAVGPPTRGAFFEIDAIPEIREQCRRIAKQLSYSLAPEVRRRG